MYWRIVERAIAEKPNNKKYDLRSLDLVSESVGEKEFAGYNNYKEPRVSLV